MKNITRNNFTVINGYEQSTYSSRYEAPEKTFGLSALFIAAIVIYMLIAAMHLL